MVMCADRYSILSSLEVKTAPGMESWVAQFGQFWSGLRSLTLSGTWYEVLKKSKETPAYRKLINLLKNVGSSGIQELALDTGDMMEEAYADLPLFLLGKSPELKRLKWTAHDKSGHKRAPMTILAKADATELPPECLQRLEFLELPNAQFDDTDFRQVVPAVRSLAGLNLSKTNFDGSHWKFFQEDMARHLVTLTQVNVLQCISLKGETVQEILCSLPNLEIFQADYIKDVNFLEDNRPGYVIG